MQPIRRKEEGEEQKYNPADGGRREKEGDTQHRQDHRGNRQQEGANIKQKYQQSRQKGQRQSERRNQYFQQYLHHQNLLYSFYLYFINTVFISLATYVVVRLLKYPKKVFLNKQREKIVTRYVGVIVFFTIVPSLFLSYNLIRASYFNDRVRTFVADELSFPNTQILSKTVTDTSDKKEVKVVLIGETVPETMIANARAKMPKYGLKNVGLVVQQGFGQEATDINELKSLLMQDLYKNSEEVLRAQSLQIDSLKRDLNKYHSYNHLTSELMPEMKVLFPYIKEVSCAHTYLMDMDSIKPDTVLLVYLKSKEKVREAEQEKIKKWLAARVEQKKIKLIIE